MIYDIYIDLITQLQWISGEKYAIFAGVTQEHKDILTTNYPIYHLLYQKVPNN